ncbi:tryptophan 2,3-dioxygenase family protein [Streptomyces sp. NPDC091268]|uniref:tryptophan 2,3-dioxygenase family protein n=1 Tax=Streptomyces sp. NPDC091268 TaxID=3365979 RepID=UPI003813236B
MRELDDWLEDPEPRRFPFAAVLGEFQRVGKHFVDEELLKTLAVARDRLPGGDSAGVPAAAEPADADAAGVLERFLDTALDKFDGRYDYPTYTALSLLAPPRADARTVRVHRDRTVVRLLGDLVRFELAAAEGRTALFPELRPDPVLVGKRHRLAVRVAAPALRRLGLADPGGPAPSTDPAQAARRLWETVDASMSGPERLVLALSMLPVHTTHDEYLFIRVLQAFEATFTLLAAELRGAITALDGGDRARAVGRVTRAAGALTESAPLFSLLATMQVEAFQTFREYTDGASAIQSRAYKLVESLCRTPDADRLHSHAYRSVPEVRAGVLAGRRTLDEAYADARGDAHPALGAAMEEFASALRRWRQTHYRLAVRMLGTRPGTGATEGTPYLGEVRKIPVFDALHPTANASASAA